MKTMKTRIIAAVLTILLMSTTKAQAQLFDPGNYHGQFTYSGLTSVVLATVDGNFQGSSGTLTGTMLTPWGMSGGTCVYGRAGAADPCLGILYVFPPETDGTCSPKSPSLVFCSQIGG